MPFPCPLSSGPDLPARPARRARRPQAGKRADGGGRPRRALRLWLQARLAWPAPAACGAPGASGCARRLAAPRRGQWASERPLRAPAAMPANRTRPRPAPPPHPPPHTPPTPNPQPPTPTRPPVTPPHPTCVAPLQQADVRRRGGWAVRPVQRHARLSGPRNDEAALALPVGAGFRGPGQKGRTESPAFNHGLLLQILGGM